MTAPRPQSIPVFLLVKSAFQVLWQQRDDALRLGFIPTLLCFGGLFYGRDALIIFGSQMQSGAMTTLPAGVALSVLATLLVLLLAMGLAIGNWLRFMLLGPMGAVGLGIAIGRPHVSFLVSCAALMFASSIALMVLIMPIRLFPQVMAGIGFVAAVIAVLVAATRLALFLIGQVIAQPMSLQQAWKASQGNGIALTISLILVQVPLWLVISLLNQILFAIGFASVAPLAMMFIASVFQIAAAFLQANVLAAAFRQLVGIQA